MKNYANQIHAQFYKRSNCFLIKFHGVWLHIHYNTHSGSVDYYHFHCSFFISLIYRAAAEDLQLRFHRFTSPTSIDKFHSSRPAWAYQRKPNWRRFLTTDVRQVAAHQRHILVDTVQCQSIVMSTWIANIRRNESSDAIGRHLPVFSWKSSKRLSREHIIPMFLQGNCILQLMKFYFLLQVLQLLKWDSLDHINLIKTSLCTIIIRFRCLFSPIIIDRWFFSSRVDCKFMLLHN